MKILIPQFIIKQYEQRSYSGELTAFTMFIDISGFTKLTETLMLHDKYGAEVLTDVLNNIFNPLVEDIYQNGGMISTFAGDAFTAIFPVSNIPAEKMYEVVFTSAKYIEQFFEDNKIVHTKFGKFTMEVKVGLSYGDVKWGILGSAGKYTYYFRGEAIDGCAKSEHKAEKGDIIIDKKFIDQLENIDPQSKLLKSLNYKVGDTHFKVDTTYIDFEMSKKLVKKFELKEEDLTPFTLDTIINLKVKAEFREVVSVFISFDEPSSEDSLNVFATELIKQSYSYGGYFNKIDFGDKGGVALIIFGAPISYENNIERALDFILDIKKESLNIDFRAGITYGTVYAGIMGGEKRCEYTTIGDIVNLSARFMMKSNWGEFWVSEEIFSNQQVTHKFKDLGSFRFKGKSGKISAYELIKKKEKIQQAFFEGKFFGREEELKKLEDFVKPIFNKKKSTGILYVYGEAGIGKSRLVWEAKNSIMNSKSSWFSMPCEEIIRKSFNPIIYFLNNYFDLSIENTKDENKSKFELKYRKLIDSTNDNSEIKKELIRTTSIIGGYLNIEWENSLYSQLAAKGRYENFLFAFTTFIQAESLIKPVIIEIEDTHWIDSDSEKLLKILTRNTQNYPISIICPSRYSDDGSEFKLNIDIDLKTDKIDLNFLKKNSISEYGKEILKIEYNFSKEMLDFIYEKTNGNPFFVEQILLGLKESNSIKKNKKNELFIDNSKAKDIPSNIQAVVISRLDRLSNDIKNIVQTASVLGREFLIKILTQVLKHEKELDRKLTNIEEEKIWSSLSEINYLFKHTLLRDSAYDMQLRSKLKELHKFAAESYIDVFEDSVKEYYGEIAYHYEKAEVRDKTIEYLIKAGDYSKGNFSNNKALDFYSRSIGFLAKNSLLLLTVLYKKGDILKLIGKWDDASANYGSSLNIAIELGDKEIIAKLKGRIGWMYYSKGEFKEAKKFYESDLNISEELKDKRGISRAFENIGSLYSAQGDYSKAMEYYEKNLKIRNELGDKLGISKAIGTIGGIYLDKGNYSKAMECYEKQLEISTTLENESGISLALGNIGVIHIELGNDEKAFEYFDKLLHLCENNGDKQGISVTVGNLGILYANQHNYEKALKYYRTKLEISEELGNKSGISIVAGNMGIIYFEQGFNSKALSLFNKDLKIKEELGDKRGISTVIGNIGIIYKTQGNFIEAMECYERALEIDYELNLEGSLPYHLLDKAECCYEMKNYFEAKETNEKCYRTSEKIKLNEFILKSNILKEKIEFKLLDNTQEKLKIINNLKNLLKDQKEEENIAIINYELAIMSYELKENNPEYKKIAIDIFKKLSKKTPKIEFKNKYKELEKI